MRAIVPQRTTRFYRRKPIQPFWLSLSDDDDTTARIFPSIFPSKLAHSMKCNVQSARFFSMLFARARVLLCIDACHNVKTGFARVLIAFQSRVCAVEPVHDTVPSHTFPRKTNPLTWR